MAQLDVQAKLAILADAAKYDASCASSGTAKRDSRGGKGMGSTEGMGICHAYAPDGRCISLLKILLTNSCIFDCAYCINRKSSNVRRARFTAEEVVRLTLAFYSRNYIEGLFLSSGIIRSSNYTMEQLVEVARSLREDHDFRGYIHLKTIPDADPELVRQAGLYADRVSINVELPTERGLTELAPEKDAAQIEGAMRDMKASIVEASDARKRFKSAPQIRAGRPVDPDDRRRRRGQRCRHRRQGQRALRPLRIAAGLLFGLLPDPRRQRRAAAQAPAADARASALPVRLADALLRLRSRRRCRRATDDGMLPLDIDPKLAWALKFRESFPVDVNRAPQGDAAARAGPRHQGGRPHPVVAALAEAAAGRCRRLTVSIAKVRPFIVTADWRPTLLTDRADLRALSRPSSSSWNCSQPDRGRQFGPALAHDPAAAHR